jgi:hypothetical protein
MFQYSNTIDPYEYSEDIETISPLKLDDSNTNSSSNNPSTVHIPILRCVDKPSSSLLSRLTFTEDIIRASIGFCKIDTIKKRLHDLYQNTITLDH